MKNAKPLDVDLIACLHPERWGDERVIFRPNPGVSVAVLAGDLGTNPQQAAGQILEARKVYPTVAFISGNNEVRESLLTYGNFNLQDTEGELRQEIGAINRKMGGGVAFLNDGQLVIGDTAIIGRNGYFGYDADKGITPVEAMAQQADRFNQVLGLGAGSGLAGKADVAEQIKKQQMVVSSGFNAKAKRTTPVTIDDIANIRRQAIQDFRDLRDELVRLNDDPGIKNVVVVTHMVPHIPGVPLLDFKKDPAGPDTDDNRWSPLVMSTMANTLLHRLAGEFNTAGKVGTYLFAHQHRARDMVIPCEDMNGVARPVRFVSNPCGDPGQNHTKGDLQAYRPLKVTVA